MTRSEFAVLSPIPALALVRRAYVADAIDAPLMDACDDNLDDVVRIALQSTEFVTWLTNL